MYNLPRQYHKAMEAAHFDHNARQLVDTYFHLYFTIELLGQLDNHRIIAYCEKVLRNVQFIRTRIDRTLSKKHKLMYDEDAAAEA